MFLVRIVLQQEGGSNDVEDDEEGLSVTLAMFYYFFSKVIATWICLLSDNWPHLLFVHVDVCFT